jgi:hypothetical protein
MAGEREFWRRLTQLQKGLKLFKDKRRELVSLKEVRSLQQRRWVGWWVLIAMAGVMPPSYFS